MTKKSRFRALQLILEFNVSIGYSNMFQRFKNAFPYEWTWKFRLSRTSEPCVDHSKSELKNLLKLIFLQLLGVVLSLTSVPMVVPKELIISEILCHSSFSSKGDKMDKFCDSLPVECLLWSESERQKHIGGISDSSP